MSALIYAQISKVMKGINAISKDRKNEHQGFMFRGIDDVMNELHSKLAEAGIIIVPEVLEERREERPTKNGGVNTYVILKIKYTFFAEDGSNVSATMIGEAMDSGDKASNKAQSVALKYACLQIFAIPTKEDKDPDGVSHEFAPTSPPVVAAPNSNDTQTFHKSAGDWLIQCAKTTWRTKTIAQVVDEVGLPAFMKDVRWWATESNAKSRDDVKLLYAKALDFEAEIISKSKSNGQAERF